MQSILVKEIMVLIEEYATVSRDANLYEAVIALEKAQIGFDTQKYKHRAILVLDENNKVVGKLSIFDILTALEPKYGKLEAEGILSHSGYNPEFVKSILQDNALWRDPLEFVCNRATKLKVSNFMETPEDGVFIRDDATLDEAIHQLVLQKHHSLLVTSGDEVVGILRLSDVFAEICDKIKTCQT